MGHIQHLFLEEENFVLTIADGEITDEIFLKHIAIVNQSDKLKENYREIVDLRNVSPKITPSSESIFKAGHFEGGRTKPRKIAVLASHEFIYGLARIYDAHTPHAEIEVFEDLAQGIDWLGVEELSDRIKEFYSEI